MCLAKVSVKENFSSQRWHSLGLTPVCVNKCLSIWKICQIFGHKHYTHVGSLSLFLHNYYHGFVLYVF
jgi:hypothetical protein